MAKKILTAFVCYIIVVVVADLVGVLAVTLFDILIFDILFDSRFDIGALYYAIWLVIGVYGGIYYTSACEQGSRGQYSPRDGILATSVSFVLSTMLIFLFYQLGEMSTNAAKYNYYVPGHKYVTYTFFVTFVATAFVVNYRGRLHPE
jgi:hypothetical protein